MIFTSKVTPQNPLILERGVKAKQFEDGSYESVEILIKRFRKSMQKSGKLVDYMKHQYYESPSVKRKKKHENAVKRIEKERKKRDMYYTRNNFN